MRMMLNGFSGYLRMSSTNNEALKLTDTAITIVVTLLVATTWAMLR